MTQLSLHHLTMLAAHPLALVEAAAIGGFEYCGIRLVAPTAADTVFDLPGNPQIVRELSALLRSTGVRLLDIEAVWLQPETNLVDLEAALEVGALLGAKHVLTVGFDTDAERLFENFCGFCELAARYEMSVALEFITYCSIGTLDQAASMVRRSRQPNAKLLIDALQFFRSGASPQDVAVIDSALIPYMQLCDGLRTIPSTVEGLRREARTDRRLPGEGELPIATLLENLPPHIPLSVEAPTLRLAGLPFNDQARIVGDVTRRFLLKTDWRQP